MSYNYICSNKYINSNHLYFSVALYYTHLYYIYNNTAVNFNHQTTLSFEVHGPGNETTSSYPGITNTVWFYTSACEEVYEHMIRVLYRILCWEKELMVQVVVAFISMLTHANVHVKSEDFKIYF